MKIVLVKIFLATIFLGKIFLAKIFLVKIFLAKLFLAKLFSVKLFFSDPSPHLTALQITPPLLSSSSVIFEVECDTTNEITDQTEHTMMVLGIQMGIKTGQVSPPEIGMLV